MKIGYPCINTSIGCTANRTFRLKSYSEKNLKEKVKENLDCLYKILQFNVDHKLLFFRIGSQLIPFASHPICKFNWKKYFKKDFEKIGNYIKKNKIRISMHPNQFTVLNSPNEEIVKKSIKEIEYHCDILDSLKLDSTAKVQIHIGGVYNEKEKSIERFIKNYKKLNRKIKKRLVIENDDISYSLKDCLFVHKKTKIPVLLDVFHHQCLNNKETVKEAVSKASKTWKKKDGVLMIDYSNQKANAKKGTHSNHINLKDYKNFIKQIKIDFDIMFEIKDKEKSALEVINL